MALENHNSNITLSEFLGPMSPKSIYVIAMGSYSPDPEKTNRYSLFLEKENEIRPLKDGWLSMEEAKKLSDYSIIIIADSDAMYATEPTVVWYVHKEIFKVYEENKGVFRVEKQRVILHKKEYAISEITGIHIYLNGWTEFGVKLILNNGELTLIKQLNPIAAIDFTYDGLNLMADTFWACMLGKKLAEFMDKPCIIDEDLQ